MGLDADSKKVYRKFSLGMKQKLAIAQAFMEKPHILLLDQPMNGLDEESVENMRGFFKEYVKEHNAVMVLTSHNREDIGELSSCTYRIGKGGNHCISQWDFECFAELADEFGNTVTKDDLVLLGEKKKEQYAVMEQEPEDSIDYQKAEGMAGCIERLEEKLNRETGFTKKMLKRSIKKVVIQVFIREFTGIIMKKPDEKGSVAAGNGGKPPCIKEMESVQVLSAVFWFP